ncbi:MAG TPA: alpha/beta hydrolase [Acidimicrobiales bacterium]|nr:alpha/beta hydrolase [Acidimicrobiales bacterium]
MTSTTQLRLGRADLALHRLSDSDSAGRPLLLLHGLGERSPEVVPPTVAEHWHGDVFSLDFLGHGASSRPRGGGYTAEQLMGDVDAALAEVGEATLLGRGIGAYIALLVAGARADLVRGAILADGPGMAGGGPSPSSPVVVAGSRVTAPEDPDPFALAELARDVRPPDYAVTFARLATTLSPLTTPVAVTAIARPDWLTAVLGEPGVQECKLAEALKMYASEGQGTAIA